MHPEGQPQLECAQRSGVFERHVDRIARAGDVRRLVSEGCRKCRLVAHHDDATGLGHEHPLVRVHGHRVRTIQAREALGHDRRRRQAVCTVDMHPDPVLGADIRDGIERVYCPGECGARCADDGDRRESCRKVGADHGVERVGAHAAVLIDRYGAQVVGPDAEQLDRSHDGVVRIRRAVGHGTRRRTRPPAARHRALACRGECGDVGDGATGGEGSAGEREADELRRPSQRLRLDERGRTGVQGEVGVVGVREQVSERADL